MATRRMEEKDVSLAAEGKVGADNDRQRLPTSFQCYYIVGTLLRQ